jgi:oligoendopeptidase F
MKKEMFLKQFPKELEYEVSKLYNSFENAEKYDIIVYTEEFYTPNIWKKLTDKIENIKIITDGIFENSDRRQIVFIPIGYYENDSFDTIGKNKGKIRLSNPNNSYNQNFPCKLLKISVNSKFKEYRHKDFLGSLMGLNIKRELMGDLIQDKENAYIPVSDKISDYILTELKQIGRALCTVKEIDIKNGEIVPEYKYDDKFITIPSKRLDSIVSAITNLSRNKVIEPIEKGKVLIDYYEEKDKSKIVEIDSLITIRGYGKYKLFSEHGETKKGKERLLIKKYV